MKKIIDIYKENKAIGLKYNFSYAIYNEHYEEYMKEMTGLFIYFEYENRKFIHSLSPNIIVSIDSNENIENLYKRFKMALSTFIQNQLNDLLINNSIINILPIKKEWEEYGYKNFQEELIDLNKIDVDIDEIPKEFYIIKNKNVNFLMFIDLINNEVIDDITLYMFLEVFSLSDNEKNELFKQLKSSKNLLLKQVKNDFNNLDDFI